MSCAGFALRYQGRVALVRDRSGHWSFPKGKYEKSKDGHSFYECARRELWEETRLTNYEYKYLLEPTALYTCKGNVSCYYFLAEITRTLSTFTILPRSGEDDDDEIEEFRWFSADDLPAEGLLENRRALALTVLETPFPEEQVRYDVFLDRQREVAISKKLSYELRHNMDAYTETSTDGFVPLSQVVDVVNAYLDEPLMKGELEYVVAKNEKRRFTIDGDRIRANQGHSEGSKVESEKLLTLLTEPLEYCVHGTTKKKAELIQQGGGLNRMSRKHIHMAIAPDATSGFRKTSSVLIHVDTAALLAAGHKLYLSSNQVVLSEDPIPLAYLTFEYRTPRGAKK